MDEIAHFVVAQLYKVSEVGACKAHAEDAFFSKSKLLLDVVYDGVSGCGRERKDGCVGEELADFLELKIRRAEIVAPL